MFPRWLALPLTASLLAACGGLGGEPEIAATLPAREAELSASASASAWQPDIAAGGRIFAERCVECHGISGDGRGDLVLAGSIEQPLDMTDHAAVAEKSPLAWFEIITEGKIDKLMPPWRDALSEAERWDVALYSYSLAYDEALLALGERLWRDGCPDCALPATVPPVYSDMEYGEKLNQERFSAALTRAEALVAAAYARMRSLERGGRRRTGSETAETLAIRGRIEQGTAGGVLPGEMAVQLRYGNSEIGYRQAETAAAADGAFEFADIPHEDAFNYWIAAPYGGRLFSRRVMPGEQDDANLTVYEATDDPRVVSLARIELVIDPAALEDMGGGLLISQLLTYRNRSDRVYTSGRGFDDGREAALLIQFPLGARLLSGDGQGRYVVIEDLAQLPDSVIDTQPVPPGERHELLLEYWLPYETAASFEQTFTNMIDAAVRVTLAADLQIESDWLLPLASEGAGEAYQVYAADLKSEGSGQLRFGISGDPFATSSDNALVVTSETLPALLLGAGTLAALLGAFGWMKRRKDECADEIDGLVRALAQLEDDHDQGRVNHDLYHRRRRELKATLAEWMGSADE